MLLSQVHVLRGEGVPVCDGHGQCHVLSCESVELRIDFVGAVSCDLAVCRSREFRFVGDGHLVGRGREVSVGIVDGVDKDFERVE